MSRAAEHAPPIEDHRLIGDGRTAALILPDAAIDWWCAPAFDSPPLLWWLLDPGGSAATWRGARALRLDDRPAGPSARTVIETAAGAVECWDGLLPGPEGPGSLLVRLVRALGQPVEMVHELRLGGLDTEAARWRGCTASVAGARCLIAGGRSTPAGTSITTAVAAERGRWAGLCLAVDCEPIGEAARLADLLERAEDDVGELLAGARLPRHHPERARDALLVLNTCTFRATGAVVAAPTTSLPESPGGTAQWDYRYTWLRDASLAVSVAALLGRGDVARRYLAFVLRMTEDRVVPSGPLTDVHGRTPPPEREVDAAGWAGSRPVRFGNDARDQIQYDALGLLVHAVSMYLQTGGSLDPPTWDLVRSIADELAGEVKERTNGIWELRQELPLVDADIGRWLALHNALWIARLRHPFTRRRHWKAARDAARSRVLSAIRADGGLPQAYSGGRNWSDASSLMIPVFSLLGHDDGRAHALVDAVRRDLGAAPFLYRFPPDTPYGREGAFLPVSWWASTALAVLGRYEEASELAEVLCSRLPRLLSEEVDPEGGGLLGNAPLVWSHMEAARTMYVLDAARVRHRYGPVGLTAWRIARYMRLRRGGRSTRRAL